MSIGFLPQTESELAELCAVALNSGEYATLIGASAAIIENLSQITKSEADVGALFAKTLIEAGYLNAARELVNLMPRRYMTEELLKLAARLARRSRRPIEIASPPPLVEATNLWLVGMPKTALAKIEVALIRAPQDVDALICKALILSDLGFVKEAMTVCESLEEKKLFGLASIESMALQIQLDLDLKKSDVQKLKDFRAAVSIPGLPEESDQFIDLLELPIRLRMEEPLRSRELIERAKVHPWAGPFVPLLGIRAGMPANQSLRRRVTLSVVKASRASRPDSLRLVEEALQLAEVEEFMAPFLEFKQQIGTLVFEVTGGRATRFQERLLNLIAQPTRGKKKSLTKRELLVMRLHETGLSTQQIADDLHVSRETVKSHCHHVIEKLGVKTRAEALEYLRELGLLS